MIYVIIIDGFVRLSGIDGYVCDCVCMNIYNTHFLL